jgi:uncharacterized protein (TIGR03435 family)
VPKRVGLLSLAGLGVMTIQTLGYAQVSNADSLRPHCPTCPLKTVTIKPTVSDLPGLIHETGGRLIATNQSLKALIAVAYNLTSGEISGGPTWVDSDHYDISAVVSDEPRAMLQKILTDKFKMIFHREQKEIIVYALTVAGSGSKLTEHSTMSSHSFVGRSLVPHIGMVLYPESILLPGRQATMGDLSLVLQRFALDRPVLDKTGLAGKYDFDLKFTPDSDQFSGSFKDMNIDKFAQPGLFIAIQEQLGLKLEPTKLLAEVLVIDSIERLGAN